MPPSEAVGGPSPEAVGLPAAESACEPPADLLRLGRIVGSYGLRGWIHVEPINLPEDSVLRLVRRWWVRPASSVRAPGAPRAVAAAAPVALSVERVRAHGGALVAKPSHCADREAAAALKGFEILVSRAEFPPGADGEYYWSDLVGCEVLTPDDQSLGRVFAVEDHGAHPLLRLHRAEGGERMIPFIGVFIAAVDLARRRIVADWPVDD